MRPAGDQQKVYRCVCVPAGESSERRFWLIFNFPITISNYQCIRTKCFFICGQQQRANELECHTRNIQFFWCPTFSHHKAHFIS